ncbi:hypothetical protein [Pedobacter gandavensis]|uniref:Uncharacterized protein n=1 Tax=Pedobacter gandavensis TaxID=2679963 RepID=A0ABR6ESH3_9SPHI|nr:hypothetical protein [Pedobacter gandavensis]MBB2148002.1 hypothetical protein [Pedobacter gandavensis]
MKTPEINGPLLLIFLFGFSLFIFSIFAGYKLSFGQDPKSGVIYSLVNHGLQLFQWSLFGYSFCYFSGIAILIGMEEFSFKANFNIASNFQLYFNTNLYYFFKINLFAVLMIVVLLDLRKELVIQHSTDPERNREIDRINAIKGLEKMTINQRLEISGLLDEFTETAAQNKTRAREILVLLRVDEEFIEELVPE